MKLNEKCKKFKVKFLFHNLLYNLFYPYILLYYLHFLIRQSTFNSSVYSQFVMPTVCCIVCSMKHKGTVAANVHTCHAATVCMTSDLNDQ